MTLNWKRSIPCEPFDFDELLTRLEALSRRGREFRAPAATVLRIAYLELDRSTMKDVRAGRLGAL